MRKQNIILIEFYLHRIFGAGAFIMDGQIRFVFLWFVLQIELPWLNNAFRWLRRKFRKSDYTLVA